MDDSWIKNKVAIVTGGGSGIGRAIAIEVARQGAIAVIADVNEAMGKEAASEIMQAGHQGHFITTDVTDKKSIGDLVLRALELGPLHFLVNSAGVQTYGTVESTPEEVWDQTMDVNLKSMYLMANRVIPEIKKNGEGAVVNISSVQGIRSQRNVAAYATQKQVPLRSPAPWGSTLLRKESGLMPFARVQSIPRCSGMERLNMDHLKK